MRGGEKQRQRYHSRVCLSGTPLSSALLVSSPLSLPLLFALLAVLIFAPGSVPTASAQSPNIIQAVRTIATDDATRVVITLSHSTPYQITTEPPASASQPSVRPTHLHITFSPAELGATVPSTLNVRDALLASVHSGQVAPSAVRLSLELARVSAYRVTELRSPYQVVISLRSALDQPRAERELSRQRPLSRQDSQSLLPESQPQHPEHETPRLGNVPQHVSLPTPFSPPAAEESPRGAESDLLLSSSNNGVKKTRRYRIMLDPGHGGYDPGAQGISGLSEKTVVLAISKRLAQKLHERLEVEVLLTRSRDIFVPLPERTAQANAAKADLFISIHANASLNTAMHGIETYYLNNTNDHATIRLAKIENGIRQQSHQQRRGAELSFILSDLIQTGKEEESIALARSLQRSLVHHAREHSPEARDLGVKKGPFYVLVGAHMPCVLVETAFLTHPLEGKRLGSSTYQDALAEGLFQGIVRFLRSEVSTKDL